MTEDEAYKVHIQYTFNAFCKIVIRHAAIDIILKLRRRWEREVSLDYLMNEKFVQLAGADTGRDFPLLFPAPAAASDRRTYWPDTQHSGAAYPACLAAATAAHGGKRP